MLLLSVLSSFVNAQNNETNQLSDTGSTLVFTVQEVNTESFSDKTLTNAISFKYIGLGASFLGANMLSMNNPNSSDENEVAKAQVGLILSIGGGIVAFISQVIQDVQLIRLARITENSSRITTASNAESEAVGLSEPNSSGVDIDNGFDGKYMTGGRNFSLFKVIRVNDDNVNDPSILIRYSFDGEFVEIWVKSNSDKLIWTE